MAMSIKVMKSGASSLSLNINIDKLALIEKALGRSFKTQVGVLGSSPHNRSVVKPRMATVRNSEGVGRPSKKLGSDLTNAEIGAIHEFGQASRKIPPRSFLMMPLTFHLYDELVKKAAVINRNITLADIQTAYGILGVAAENTVQEGFQNGGWGNWPALKPETIERKGSDKILIDTAQLRKSITSRVV